MLNSPREISKKKNVITVLCWLLTYFLLLLKINIQEREAHKLLMYRHNQSCARISPFTVIYEIINEFSDNYTIQKYTYICMLHSHQVTLHTKVSSSPHLSNFQFQHSLSEAQVFVCFDLTPVLVPQRWGLLLHVAHLKGSTEEECGKSQHSLNICALKKMTVCPTAMSHLAFQHHAALWSHLPTQVLDEVRTCSTHSR